MNTLKENLKMLGLESVIKELQGLELQIKKNFQSEYNYRSLCMFYTRFMNLLMKVRNIMVFWVYQ